MFAKRIVLLSLLACLILTGLCVRAPSLLSGTAARPAPVWVFLASILATFATLGLILYFGLRPVIREQRRVQQVLADSLGIRSWVKEAAEAIRLGGASRSPGNPPPQPAGRTATVLRIAVPMCLLGARRFLR